MTITQAVPTGTSTVPMSADPVLTDHDYIIGDGQPYPDLSGCYLPFAMGFTLHLRDTTPIVVRVHESKRRVVVSFGANSVEADLFLKADQLDRLITVLTAARGRLCHS